MIDLNAPTNPPPPPVGMNTMSTQMQPGFGTGGFNLMGVQPTQPTSFSPVSFPVNNLGFGGAPQPVYTGFQQPVGDINLLGTAPTGSNSPIPGGITMNPSPISMEFSTEAVSSI